MNEMSTDEQKFMWDSRPKQRDRDKITETRNFLIEMRLRDICFEAWFTYVEISKSFFFLNERDLKVLTLPSKERKKNS